MIAIQTLRQLLRLDRDTGRLFWLYRERALFKTQRSFSTWNTRYCGTEALTAPLGGYRHGNILGRHYVAHVVVFALEHGRWAIGDVDHRDTDKGNNRPDNLREATRQQNMRNSGSKGGISNFCGVTWHKGGKKWMAYCSDDVGKRHHLGLFDDEHAAARAYDAAARRWHGQFARLNFAAQAAA